MCKKQRKPSRALVVSNLAKKRVSGFLAGVLLVGGLLTPRYEAEAHEAYFLAFLPNIDQLSYQSLVTGDSPKAERDHLEFNFVGGAYQLGDEGVLSSVPLSVTDMRDSDIQDKGGDTQCMFTFPTCSTSGSWLGDITDVVGSFFSGGNAQSEDRYAADRVGKELVSGANSALSYISNTLLTKDGKKLSYSTDLSGTQKEAMFFQITANLANVAKNVATGGDGDNHFTVDHGGYPNTYTIERLSNDERDLAGFNSSSTKDNVYLRIKHQDDSSKGAVFLYSTVRYQGLKTEYADKKGATSEVNLFQMIAFANASYAFGGVTSTNVEAVAKPNFIEQIIINILNSILGSLRSLLGLNTMSELMFNEGSYGVNTYKGLAPISWFQASDVLFWVSQVFAWLLLAFASLKFLGMHMWSTITPMKRVSLMNGIQNILITAFLLSMIVPIFNVIAEFNYLIVGVLRDSSEFNDSLVSGQMFPGTLGGIVLAIFFFLSEIVINFMYILRGATICLLYGLSPVFVVAFAFGGRFQGITFKFVKELIGNIFIQTFHAIVLTFYGLFFLTGNSGGFLTSLVLVFAFIPMTKVFKEITGIGESGFIQGVAEQAKGTVSSITKGATGAALSGPIDSITNKRKDGGEIVSNTEQPSGPTPDPGFKTSSYEREKELNSSKENRSVSESLPTTPVTLEKGGGTPNEFGVAELSDNQIPSTPTKGEMAKKSLRAVGNTVAAATLGGVAGAFGNKTLGKLAEHQSQKMLNNTRSLKSDYNSWKDAKGDAKASGGHILMGTDKADLDLDGNANSEVHTYNGRDAADAGIMNMYQQKVDENQCLVQEFSGDAAVVGDLSKISFDETTGRVTDEKALSQGITHISRMENGNYRVALDMKKNNIKECRSMGGGSRYQVKTSVEAGCDDMNYTSKAIERMQNSSNTTTSLADSTSNAS